MSNFYRASAYKNKIINLLLQNEDFIKLVNPQEPVHEDLDVIDMLLGGSWILLDENGKKKQYKVQGSVFDFTFVPETTTDEKTFVCVETNIPKITKRIFTEFNLVITVFTNKNLVSINKGTVPTVKEVKNMGYFTGHTANRIDVLCDIIDKTLNGNEKIHGIGDIHASDRYFCENYIPNNKFYGKSLLYNITNLNQIEEFCDDN